MGTRNRTARAVLLVAIAATAAACRSRPLDGVGGTGMIALDGGSGDRGAALDVPRAWPLGAACANRSDCSSGFCEDGFCCTGACGGACVSCAVVGSFGLCVPSPRGAPPRSGNCMVVAQLPCGYDGTCDGTGACSYRVNRTPCAPGRCSETALLDRKACDGEGVCRDLPATICDEGYGCDPVTVTCRTSCATDGGCPSRDGGWDAGTSCAADGGCWSGDADLD